MCDPNKDYVIEVQEGGQHSIKQESKINNNKMYQRWTNYEKILNM